MGDFEDFYTRFKAVSPEPLETKSSLYGTITLPKDVQKISTEGNLIFSENTPKVEEFNTDFLDRMALTHSGQTFIPSDDPNFEGGSLIDNERFAYEYLVKNKIPKGTAAGIVGNLYHEDLANPIRTVKDSHGTKAYGIAGFNSEGEYPALMAWAEKKGIKGNPNFQQQLDFIIDVIKDRPNLNILLNNNLTPTEASFIWGSQFEKFAGDNRKGYLNRNDSHHKKRAARANKIFKTYG